MLAPVPMRTLTDEYHDEPIDPPDDRIPPPEPPGILDRVIERLRALRDPERPH